MESSQLPVLEKEMATPVFLPAGSHGETSVRWAAVWLRDCGAEAMFLRDSIRWLGYCGYHLRKSHSEEGKGTMCVGRVDPSRLGQRHRLSEWGGKCQGLRASLITQLVKNLPAMQETWVWSPGWEDPLEKGKATHSSILAWRIPWAVLSMGLQRVRHNWATFTFSVRENIIQISLIL